MTRLRWNAMHLLDVDIPAGSVVRGEVCRLVMPCSYQYAWLQAMHGEGADHSAGDVFFETAQTRVYASDEMFPWHVACLLHQRGALANLSLRENMLLPFLYRASRKEMARAQAALPVLADWLEISGMLDEQTGERSSYVHALLSLGRIMLMQPDIIIVQDVYAGMQAHRLDRFRLLFGEALQGLGVGVLYLSYTAQNVMGLDFSHSLELAGAEDAI